MVAGQLFDVIIDGIEQLLGWLASARAKTK